MMPYSELRSELAKTHLGQKLKRTDKSFYGGLLKLETTGLAKRHGGRAATVEVFQRFMDDVKSGRAKDEPIQNRGENSRSPAKAALFEVLRISGSATASELITMLTPRLHLATRNSKTSIYNLIARLVKREELVRSGSIISFPPANGKRQEDGGDDAENLAAVLREEMRSELAH
jgi:hypothetical protein